MAGRQAPRARGCEIGRAPFPPPLEGHGSEPQNTAHAAPFLHAPATFQRSAASFQMRDGVVLDAFANPDRRYRLSGGMTARPGVNHSCRE